MCAKDELPHRFLKGHSRVGAEDVWRRFGHRRRRRAFALMLRFGDRVLLHSSEVGGFLRADGHFTGRCDILPSTSGLQLPGGDACLFELVATADDGAGEGVRPFELVALRHLGSGRMLCAAPAQPVGEPSFLAVSLSTESKGSAWELSRAAGGQGALQLSEQLLLRGTDCGLFLAPVGRRVGDGPAPEVHRGSSPHPWRLLRYAPAGPSAALRLGDCVALQLADGRHACGGGKEARAKKRPKTRPCGPSVLEWCV